MKQNRKSYGFTLAELLVVVAIIAVLVAISIPIFVGQLEKAREAVCLANARSLLASYRIEEMCHDGTGQERHEWLKESAESMGGKMVTTGTTDKVGGLCSDSAAYYNITYGANQKIQITCSKHGDVIQEYIHSMIQDVLMNMNTITRELTDGSTQTLAQFFKNSTRIDSNNPSATGAKTSFSSVIKERIGDVDDTWVLTKEGNNYVFVITDGIVLEKSDIGSTVEVRRYVVDTSNNVTLQKGTTDVINRFNVVALDPKNFVETPTE